MGSILRLLLLFGHLRLFATPWMSARQASVSFTISQSLLRLMSIESVMPSNHLILCCPYLLLPSIFPGIRIFSSESDLHISDQSSQIPELKAVIVSKLKCYYTTSLVVTDCPRGQESVSIAFELTLPEQRIRKRMSESSWL